MSLLVLILAQLLTECGHALSLESFPSPYQCQASSEDSGRVFTPNIPDQHFQQSNIASLSTGEGFQLTQTKEDLTYVFLLPPVSTQRNCSGRVVSLQYCYQVDSSLIGESISAFHFLSLTQDGQEFTVKSRHRVRTTPHHSICTNSTAESLEGYLICCDQESSIEARNFHVPASDYAYGILVRQVQLLAFAGSVGEYNYEQFQVSVRNNGRPGITFTLTQANRFTNLSLPLLRFTLEPDELSTQPVATITDQDLPVHNRSDANDTDTSDAYTDTGDTNTSDERPGLSSSSSKMNIIIIGVLSGVVAMCGLLTPVLILVIAVMLRREGRASNVKKHTPQHEGGGYRSRHKTQRSLNGGIENQCYVITTNS